jgi:cell wall assembly regulator SMI1
MTTVFERFIDALSASSDRLERFSPGASPAEIEDFRRAIGLDVPELLIELHAWRDGTTPLKIDDAAGTWSGNGRIYGYEWHSLSAIVEKKRSLDGWAAGGAPNWESVWNPAWLPLADNHHSMIMLATAPCFGGPAGQIVWFDYKSHIEYWSIEHESLEEWLTTVTALAEADLLDGEYNDDEVEDVVRGCYPTRWWVPVEPPTGDRFERPRQAHDR